MPVEASLSVKPVGSLLVEEGELAEAIKVLLDHEVFEVVNLLAAGVVGQDDPDAIKLLVLQMASHANQHIHGRFPDVDDVVVRDASIEEHVHPGAQHGLIEVVGGVVPVQVGLDCHGTCEMRVSSVSDSTSASLGGWRASETHGLPRPE